MVNRRNLLKLSALGTASFAAPQAYSASKITMAYNTGNAPGSKDPRDLIDNSEDLDLLMTAEADYEPNRLGAPLQSWKGMMREFGADQARRESEFDADQTRRETEFDVDQEQREYEFDALMEATGYEPPIPYAPGIVLDRTTKTVSYLGNEYRAKGSFIPMTTSNWAADEAKLKLIGDDSLRQNLEAVTGVMGVGGATVNLDALVSLRAFKGRRAGDIASIQSFHSGWALNVAHPFPCGGGEFVWDATSTASVIPGMVEQVTAEVNGRWKRKFSGAVHVTWTGAVPDGLTKCSAAVQTALDNFTAVYIPPGKFVIDRATSHPLLYTSTVVDCGVKITQEQKCLELYGAGEASLLISEPGVRYLALISQYNVTDRSLHSFNMDGLYDRSGANFQAAITGIRQQSIRRCTTHSLKISNFAFHCLAMYGGSNATTEPACLWNKAYNLYLDGGGQTSLLVYSAAYNGLVLPNEFNEFSDIFAMNSHVYFGIEVRKSNNNTFTNIVANSNQKGGVNLEEGAANNKFVNIVSKYNQYGLHVTGNGIANVTGNRFVNFDFSENMSHNVLAFQGAVGNYFNHGNFNKAVSGNGWRSEDSSSFGNHFTDIECKNNPGEGLLFQNYEYITDAAITGNGLRGMTVFGAAKLRRIVSRNNGTDVAGSPGVLIDAVDCDFGPQHAVITKEALRVGQFIEVSKAGRYSTGGVNVSEEIIAGSFSALVWKTAVQYGTLISLPTGFFAGNGFTTLKVMLRVQTDGPARVIRDIVAGSNINIPANTGWVWATYNVAISSLTAASDIKIRFESATGFVLMDGYQLMLV